MSLQTWAIVDRVPERLPDRVRPIGSGPYLLVEDGPAQAGTSADELVARHRSLDAFSREVACLPCRYGDVLESEGAGLEWLRGRRAALVRSLARVAGHVEFDLRLRPAADPGEGAAAGGPGTRYLRAVAARYARVDEALLERIARASRAALPNVAETVVDAAGCGVAFLVTSEDVAGFANATKELVLDELPAEVGSRWSGPWPAYTFASAWLAEAAP